MQKISKKDIASWIVCIVCLTWLFISWFQFAITKDISSWNCFELMLKSMGR